MYAMCLLFSPTLSYAQQWSGPSSTTSPIGRTGLVGIGISNPSNPLKIVYDTYPQISVEGDDSDVGLEFNSGGRIIQLYTPRYSEEFRVWINNADRMTINSNGDVGIGISTPISKLSLGSDFANTKLAILDGGNYSFGIGAQPFKMIFHNGSIADDFEFRSEPTATTNLLTIRGNGNVGIGINTPSVKLHVIGNSRIVGSLATGNANNQANGVNSLVGGDSSSSAGAGSLAVGGRANATNRYTVALGGDANLGVFATGIQSVAIGNGGVTASGLNSMAFGIGALNNSVNNSLMIGFNNTVNTPTFFVGQPLVNQAIGNVGVGTSAPQSRLSINGNVSIGNSYASATAAPNNGLLVEGSMGVGTATILNGTKANIFGSNEHTLVVRNQNTASPAGVPYSAITGEMPNPSGSDGPNADNNYYIGVKGVSDVGIEGQGKYTGIVARVFGGINNTTAMLSKNLNSGSVNYGIWTEAKNASQLNYAINDCPFGCTIGLPDSKQRTFLQVHNC